MLHLIERLLANVFPGFAHRFVLRRAHAVRHRWRRIAKPHLSGVSVILHDERGRIMLVRHTYGPDCWTLPGGGLNGGEAPQTAARREMREELGIELTGLHSLGTIDETLSGTRHTAHIFVAAPGGPIAADGREIAEAAYFEPDKLLGKVSHIAQRRVALYLERMDGNSKQS